MSFQSNPELYWLVLAALATGLMWLPHILYIIGTQGLFTAVYDPVGQPDPVAPWANRAKRAHNNSVENLVIFTPLVILVTLLGKGTELTALAAMIFLLSRLAYFVVYTFAIPVLRVPLFLIGWACQMILGLAILGFI